MSKDIKELAGLSAEDLGKKLIETKKALAHLRCNIAPKDTSVFSKTRKSIARMKTLVKLKENK